MAVVRFGVSLEKEILDSLDEYSRENKFSNRSQAVRHLVSTSIAIKKWQCDNIVAGAITLVYNHHKKDLLSRIADIQHGYHDVILSTQHFHLNHNDCLEIVALKGKASQLTALSEELIAVKGIEHGRLSISKID